MIKEISLFIENATSHVIGDDLFEGYLEPSVISACIVVEELSPAYADGQLTDKVQFPVRIAVKDASAYFTARETAYEMFDLFHGRMQVTLPSISGEPTYLCNFECNKPCYMGLDDKSRFVFVVNMTVKAQTV